MKNKIRIMISAGMMISLVLLCACAKKDETAASQTPVSQEENSSSDDASFENEAQDKEPLSVSEIYKKIEEGFELPKMYLADEDFLMNYYGIDASVLEEYVFASSQDPTSADSIILIKVKDEASAGEINDALSMMLEQMEAEMENYNPEANEHVKAAKIRINGKNIDLIIHKDREKILSLIDDSQ